MTRLNGLVRTFVGLVAILVVMGCATAYNPVEVVADEQVDFSQYRTFEIDALILDSSIDGQQDLLVNQMIGQSLAEALRRKGLEQDQGGAPDLRVRFLARTKTQAGIDIEHVPTEHGVWTRYWNEPVSQGKLLVNLVDTATGSVVWKGVYTQQLDDLEVVTQSEIDRVVNQLMAAYPSRVQGGGVSPVRE